MVEHGGIIQYGFIKAWLELGLSYDVCFGTSAGALNGVVLHANEPDRLEHLWKTIKSKDVYKWSLLDLHRPLIKNKSSVYNSAPLLNVIKNSMNYEALQANPKDFWINTTDYFDQTSYSLECKSLPEEELALFLKASASPPIFFEPVNFRDKVLVDGGLTSNYNIDDALNADVETIVLMIPTMKGVRNKIRHIADIAADCISIPMYTQFNEEINSVQKINDVIHDLKDGCTKNYKTIKLVKIVADMSFDFGFLDFDYKGYDRDFLINYGYEFAKPILERELLCL